MIDAFFVYVHRKAKTGEIFYVGKGSRHPKKYDERARTKDGRNKFWVAVCEKHGFTPEVVAWFESEADAFQMERDLIAHYGLRSRGGILCNLTEGGEGASGIEVSEETRRKLRDAVAGERHPNWGKRLSEETRRRKSESMRNSQHNLRGKKLPDWWKDKIRATKLGEQNPMHGRCGAMHHGSKRVIDRSTGATYPSITAAAKAAGLSMQGLANMLSGHRINTTTMELA